MKTTEIIKLLNETQLSPESIAEWIGVSGTTYRRWLKTSSGRKFPDEYMPAVAAGIYKLLGHKFLSHDSPRVNRFLENHLPEFFQAAVGRLGDGEDFFAENIQHQDKITAVLANLGNSTAVRKQVDKAAQKISVFKEWGVAWKSTIELLTDVITSTELSLVDRLVAYGGLFYLILPFDLIPDSIPVFGYVDDFGILSMAAIYYRKRLHRYDAADTFAR